jgi:hypothetical protein
VGAARARVSYDDGRRSTMAKGNNARKKETKKPKKDKAK